MQPPLVQNDPVVGKASRTALECEQGDAERLFDNKQASIANVAIANISVMLSNGQVKSLGCILQQIGDGCQYDLRSEGCEEFDDVFGSSTKVAFALQTLAAAYGHYSLCREIIFSMDESGGNISAGHARLLCRLMRPIPMRDGPCQHVMHDPCFGSVLTYCADVEKGTPPRQAEMNDYQSLSGCESIAQEDHSFCSVRCHLSASAMALFLAESVLPCDPSDEGVPFVVTYAASPCINRHLNVERVWSSYSYRSPAMKDGVLRSIAGLSPASGERNKSSLDCLDYHCWPYCATVNFAGQPHVPAESVVFPSMLKMDGACVPFPRFVAGHPSIGILSETLSILGEQIPSRAVNGVALSVDQMICKITQTIVRKFGNLKTWRDWWSLHQQLSLRLPPAFRWLASERKTPELTLTMAELVCATKNLFQSLSPVRFAFLDGQCRIASTNYCLHGVYPDVNDDLSAKPLTGPKCDGPRSHVSAVGDEINEFMSPCSQTCSVVIHCVASPSRAGQVISQRECRALQEMGAELCLQLELAEPRTLMDVMSSGLCSPLRLPRPDGRLDELTSAEMQRLSEQRRKAIMVGLLSDGLDIAASFVDETDLEQRQCSVGQTNNLIDGIILYLLGQEDDVIKGKKKGFGYCPKNLNDFVGYKEKGYKYVDLAVMSSVLSMLTLHPSADDLLQICMGQFFLSKYSSGLPCPYVKRGTPMHNATVYSFDPKSCNGTHQQHLEMIPIQNSRISGCHRIILAGFHIPACRLVEAMFHCVSCHVGRTLGAKNPRHPFNAKGFGHVIYPTVAYQILCVISEFGMCIPVPTFLRSRCGNLYGLLTPPDCGVEGHLSEASIMQFQKGMPLGAVPDPLLEKYRWWTNLAHMVGIVSYLLVRGEPPLLRLQLERSVVRSGTAGCLRFDRDVALHGLRFDASSMVVGGGDTATSTRSLDLLGLIVLLVYGHDRLDYAALQMALGNVRFIDGFPWQKMQIDGQGSTIRNAACRTPPTAAASGKKESAIPMPQCTNHMPGAASAQETIAAQQITTKQSARPLKRKQGDIQIDADAEHEPLEKSIFAEQSFLEDTTKPVFEHGQDGVRLPATQSDEAPSGAGEHLATPITCTSPVDGSSIAAAPVGRVRDHLTSNECQLMPVAMIKAGAAGGTCGLREQKSRLPTIRCTFPQDSQSPKENAQHAPNTKPVQDGCRSPSPRKTTRGLALLSTEPPNTAKRCRRVCRRSLPTNPGFAAKLHSKLPLPKKGRVARGLVSSETTACNDSVPFHVPASLVVKCICTKDFQEHFLKWKGSAGYPKDLSSVLHELKSNLNNDSVAHILDHFKVQEISQVKTDDWHALLFQTKCILRFYDGLLQAEAMVVDIPSFLLPLDFDGIEGNEYECQIRKAAMQSGDGTRDASSRRQSSDSSDGSPSSVGTSICSLPAGHFSKSHGEDRSAALFKIIKKALALVTNDHLLPQAQLVVLESYAYTHFVHEQRPSLDCTVLDIAFGCQKLFEEGMQRMLTSWVLQMPLTKAGLVLNIWPASQCRNICVLSDQEEGPIPPCLRRPRAVHVKLGQVLLLSSTTIYADGNCAPCRSNFSNDVSEEQWTQIAGCLRSKLNLFFMDGQHDSRLNELLAQVHAARILDAYNTMHSLRPYLLTSQGEECFPAILEDDDTDINNNCRTFAADLCSAASVETSNSK